MNNKVKRIGLILALVTARLSLDVISWKILSKYVIPIISKVVVAVFFLDSLHHDDSIVFV